MTVTLKMDHYATMKIHLIAKLNGSLLESQVIHKKPGQLLMYKVYKELKILSNFMILYCLFSIHLAILKELMLSSTLMAVYQVVGKGNFKVKYWMRHLAQRRYVFDFGITCTQVHLKTLGI